MLIQNIYIVYDVERNSSEFMGNKQANSLIHSRTNTRTDTRVVGLESWTWTQVGLESDFLRTWTGLGLEGHGLGLGLGLEG